MKVPLGILAFGQHYYDLLSRYDMITTKRKYQPKFERALK